jgi:hypothetical protein
MSTQMSQLILKPFYGCYDTPYHKLVKCERVIPNKDRYYLHGEIYSQQIPAIFERDEVKGDFYFTYSNSYYQGSFQRQLREDYDEWLQETYESFSPPPSDCDSEEAEELIDYLN